MKVTSLKGLNEIQSDLAAANPQLNLIRVPVVEELAPDERCFDILVGTLKDEPASTQCVFSCQMGRGRTTLGTGNFIRIMHLRNFDAFSIGMIVACLMKEIQVSTELRKMAEIQLVSENTIQTLINQKFESPVKKKPDDNDPLISGEFDVIKVRTLCT